MTGDTLQVRIRQIRLEAEGIASYELAGVDRTELPPFTAGAHIDLHLPRDMVRSYSLLNDPAETHRYVVAVLREPDVAGGSAWMHAVPRVGDVLRVGVPTNDFPLADSAAPSVLIAGGIGITPLLAMARTLHRLRRPWMLHYAARSPSQAAFVAEIESLAGAVSPPALCFGSNRESRLDLRRIVESAPADAHFYCCGPGRMIDEFIAVSAGRTAETVHYERFSSSQEAATDGDFDVVLNSSGRRIGVQTGRSILDTLLDNGVDVQYACSAGVCGTCRTGVIEGEPDHRDDYLTDDEKQANRAIMICCSGSRSRTLVLDL